MRLKFRLVGAKHQTGYKPKYDIWGKPNWESGEFLDVRLFTLTNVPARIRDGDNEDSRYWEICPDATIELHITEQEYWDMFKNLGSDFYVDFVPCERKYNG